MIRQVASADMMDALSYDSTVLNGCGLLQQSVWRCTRKRAWWCDLVHMAAVWLLHE
jgi:hypothetical protein